MLYFEGLLPTDGGCRPSTCATSPTPSWLPRPPTPSGRPCSSAVTTATARSRVRSRRRSRGDGGGGRDRQGRKGNPNDDDALVCDRLDGSTTSQELLGFQHHTWPAILKETAREDRVEASAVRGGRAVGRRRPQGAAPLPQEPKFADPWGAVNEVGPNSRWTRHERRVAVIVGGASGIGGRRRRALAAEGAVSRRRPQHRVGPQRAAELGEPHAWVRWRSPTRRRWRGFRPRGGPGGRAARGGELRRLQRAGVITDLHAEQFRR